MKKLADELTKIQTLHQSGHLDKAENAYLQFIKDHPNDVNALSLLGLLYLDKDDLEKAKEYLLQAHHLSPNEPSIRINVGNILKKQGLFQQAAALFEQVVADFPDYPSGYNNLGTVYYAKARLDKAIHCYFQAIKLNPGYVDAYFNLGIAFLKNQQIEKAKQAFLAVYDFNHLHPGASFQLGLIAMRQKKFKDALMFFSIIDQHYPFHFETITNLATAFFSLGQLNRAKEYYLKALTINKKDTQVLYNLGVISIMEGKIKDAIHFYEAVLIINPIHFEALHNLAVVYWSQRNHASAIAYFKRALDIQPQSQSVRYSLAILENKDQIETSSNEYLRMLFNSYADHYESHLQQTLHYQVPSLFFDHLKLFSIKGNVLDLGCGTGLCAELLKKKFPEISITGIDLSDKMLDIARSKQIYSNLINEDIITFLQHSSQTFDLVIAGDVLTYIGNVEPLFKLVEKRMSQKALFIFSTEVLSKTGEDRGFIMTDTGRFQHDKRYLEKVIKDNHLTILSYQQKIIRTQENVDIQGHVFLIQK